ncbi:MAG: hypothetical protein P1R58_05015 [bacterium]|nr:hypothetical protein [bacterium]
MFKKTVFMVAALMLLVASVMAAPQQKQAKGEMTTFEGTMVCMSCDLKKAEGARSDCKAFGHSHALKTKDGKYINLLANQYSADLIKGEKYHDKPVKMSGMYFANANQLDVESFEADGKKKSWCNQCSAMDGCMAGK